MILYTKTVCPKCLGVKANIQENKLPIETINIDHNPEAKQKLLDNNIMALPVLEVNGQLITDLNTIYATLDSGV